MRRRTSWLLTIIGLLFGLAAGYIYGLNRLPANDGVCSWASLEKQEREYYILNIARVYAASGDTAYVLAHFPGLTSDQAADIVEEAAIELMSGSLISGDDAKAMLSLARAYGRTPVGLIALAGTPKISITSKALAETVTPNLDAEQKAGSTRYIISGLQVVCEATGEAAAKVWVASSDGSPVPGAHLRFEWANGEQELLTGLAKPSDPGYADMKLNTDDVYQLTVVESGLEASEKARLVASGACPSGQRPLWLVHFTRASG